MPDEYAKNPQAPAAEGAPQPREEAGNLPMDGINIPLVATVVACFVALLAVLIISLQAAFYNYQAGERTRKTLSQEDPHTELGALLAEQRRELKDGPSARRLAAGAGGATSTSAASQVKRDVKPIEEAMRLVSREYSEGRVP